MELEAASEAVGAGCAVCADDVDNATLSDEELVERMTLLGRERSRVDAMLAETAAEMHRRMGGRGAAAMMRERLHVSARQATSETELAATLSEQYPTTLASLRSGEITTGHARVIARVGADPDHADEAALLEMARGYPVDMFARMTRHYLSSQDSSSEHQRQYENRWASLVQDPDGSWRLSAYFDYSTGKRISISFNQMIRTYRNGEGLNARTSSQQRRADALANLITGEGAYGRPKTTMLVIADYDTVSRELRNLRFDDSLPVPAGQIARLASAAKILPAIFNAAGDPLWLGRAERHASAGQRIVLAARDGGCVNCGSPFEGSEPHHIEWFTRGGPTDIDNLCLLCAACHHLVHDDGWQVHSDNGQLRLRPPLQWPAQLRPRSDTHCRSGGNSHTEGRPRPDVRARPQRNPILRT